MTADLLDAASLQAGTGDGWRVEVVAETGSTNADLVARAQAGEDVAAVRTRLRAASRPAPDPRELLDLVTEPAKARDDVGLGRRAARWLGGRR